MFKITYINKTYYTFKNHFQKSVLKNNITYFTFKNHFNNKMCSFKNFYKKFTLYELLLISEIYYIDLPFYMIVFSYTFNKCYKISNYF